MGGDFGPAVVVEGAVAACREFGLASVLVGDKAAIERELTRLKAQDLPVTVRHASQVVGMAEAPSQALRRKRDSSLRVAAELVKDGECGAIVSAGNTGAAMAISMFVMGVLPGVDRPAIAAPLPSLAGYTVLIDAGANVDPKPRQLFQFAVMGHVYSRAHRGQGQSAGRAALGGRGRGQGHRADQGSLRGPARLVAQLHRQHRGARHLQRPLRRGGDRRLHRQRLPQGLREPGRDAHRDDPRGARRATCSRWRAPRSPSGPSRA